MRVYFVKPDIERLRKEHMVIDMHMHSSHSHDCSTPLEKLAEKARHLGVRLALTDHNTIAGVLAAQRIAPDIFMPAVEVTTAEGKDIIPYFYSVGELMDFAQQTLQKNVVRKSPIRSGATRISMADLLDDLSRRNCVVALPHPFAVMPRRSYTFFKDKARRQLLRHVHAVEVINQSMLHRHNLAAVGFAMQFDKSMVGGTDAHTLSAIGSTFTIAKAQSWEEFLDDLKAKRIAVIGEERGTGRQMLDATKNATRIIKNKASILKNGRFHRQG